MVEKVSQAKKKSTKTTRTTQAKTEVKSDKKGETSTKLNKIFIIVPIVVVVILLFAVIILTTTSKPKEYSLTIDGIQDEICKIEPAKITKVYFRPTI